MAMLNDYEQERDAAKERWLTGLGSEVGFWDGWIGSSYGGAPAWNELLNPNRELEPRFIKLIEAEPGTNVKVLDVGAGPLTALGPKWKHRNLTVKAVDPLAKEYRASLEKKGVTPPTWTETGDAENLSAIFSPNEFDFVYATNCLDHSYDPLRAFREIVAVLKPGCYALLDHAQNEAVAEKYTGLHQWNFDIQDGEFVLWRPGFRVFVQDALADLCVVEFETSPYQPGRLRLAIRLRKLRPGESQVPLKHANPTERYASTPSPEQNGSEVPLRYRVVDRLNDAISKAGPIHRALKRIGRTLVR